MGRETNQPYWKVLTDVSKIVKKLERKWKNHYNVHVYNILINPANKKDDLDLNFASNLIQKI
jgi:hypothetical protein